MKFTTESMGTPTPHYHKAYTGPGSKISVISQFQSDPILILDNEAYDNDVSPPIIGEEEINYNLAVIHYNKIFNKKYEYLSSELNSMLDHRHINGILELKLEYTIGGVS